MASAITAFKTVRRAVWRRLPPPIQDAYRFAATGFSRPEPGVRFTRPFLSRNKIAIDVGANTGTYLWPFAMRSLRVYAFEPNPHRAAALRALNLGNAVVEQAAASDVAGQAVLRVPIVDAGGERDALGSISAANPLSGPLAFYTVRTVRLDSLLDEIDRPIGVLKIDVEGHEEAVLRGARELIARHRPVMLLEISIHQGQDVPSVFGLLYDYDPWLVREDRLERTTAAFVMNLQRGERRQRADNVLFIPRRTRGGRASAET